jgi:asparagine synthase (glutamine-hydrolysing)
VCGFAGFLDSRPSVPVGEWPAIVSRMSGCLHHRGPDDGGHWHDPDAGIALSHRRLAILDLSPAGHQPMVSASKRLAIVFNGEIYNHLALRASLEDLGQAPSWRGHSDTETLLAAFEAWGVEKTLQATVGMFALALWDKGSRTLTLARDRLGEKPLYYGWQGSVLLFGSELKALKAHPAFAAEIDRDAVTLLLRHNAIGAPHSIYRGIRKLLPGTRVSFAAGSSPGRCPPPQPYWLLADVAASGRAAPFRGSTEEAVDALEARLSEAIAGQQLADVPLGAFLSGGIDSSTVVALMQAQSRRPVRTFSIGFHEQGYDEAHHARAIAQHLGTDHTELYVTAEQAMAVIPQLPMIWDEPFADSSQIPTYLVASLARQHVTVALSGDGGDELFAGYSRYQLTQTLWNRLSRLPAPLRREAARAITKIDPTRWDRLLGTLLPERLHEQVFGERLHLLAGKLAATSGQALYRQMVSHWKDPASVVIGGKEPELPATPNCPDLLSHMMLADGLNYLPTDILTKVDRAAMAVSLETRVPLLDHRVVEFAWRLPNELKTRDGQTKWPLRQVLHRHVPRALIERPKMGFGVPIDSWLRGPLRDWAEALLSETRLRNEGIFDPAPIRRKWHEHLSGRRQWHYYLWDVLMFQAWWEQQA